MFSIINTGCFILIVIAKLLAAVNTNYRMLHYRINYRIAQDMIYYVNILIILNKITI